MSALACPPRRAALALGLASVAVQLPFLDRGLSLLDEGSILAIAEGLSRGEVLYVDRVTPLAPLTYELLALLFRVFGTHLLVARLLELVVFSMSALLAYAILRRVAGARAAGLGGLAFLALKPLGFPLWTIVNYSQVAMLACLGSLFASVRFLETRRSRWLVAAGLGVGLAGAAKQNLGLLVGALVVVAVAADAWRSPRVLAGRGAALAAGVLPVAVALAGLLAARGALGAFLERAVLGPLSLAQPYRLGPPALDLWSLSPGEMGPRVFAYFPSPVVGVILEGSLPLASQPWVLAIEIFVEAVYYLPLGLFAIGLRAIAREPSAAGRGPALLVVGFGAAAWASMLYRADWTHLMNVYPAVILAAAVALGREGARSPWARRVSGACLGLWLAAGLAIGALVLATHGEPVETPRGRLRALPASTAESRAVLGWAAGRPRTERIAFLRAEPLHAFLAGRPVPLRFDLLLPGIVSEGDDEEIARALGGVDRVVYNPKHIPTVPSPIPEYAPRTSRRLAHGFLLERRLGRDSLVLAPRPVARERVSADLWERFDAAAAAPPEAVARGFWLFHRVLAVRAQSGAPTCFELPHDPGPGEVLVVTPLVDPERWGGGAGRVRFEAQADGRRAALELPVAEPSLEELRLPLVPEAGRAKLGLCATLVGVRPGAGLAVGWGEPRVVAPPGAGVSRGPSTDRSLP